MKGRILLINDDEHLLRFMDEYLTMNGYKTQIFQSPLEAINQLNTERHGTYAPNDIQTYNYQSEPDYSISQKKKENEASLQFIGQDPQIKKLLHLLPRIAQSDAPILIQGESGSGKEVFAHQIHQKSLRSNKPYIKINCANLPSEMAESTLFGHIKSPFTGVFSNKRGVFDAANGGTLLLEEITEIDINTQAKLLRVLQDKKFCRVGSQKPVQTDIRILATTNRNIADAITDDSFREDLYYRLNVFPISIPPLRERQDDIMLLARHFVDRYTTRYKMEKKSLSPEVETYFKEVEWRGNVRELDNKIHRGVVLSHTNEIITMEHIENNLFSTVDKELTRDVVNDLPLISIEDMELQLIKRTLEHTMGNQKKAAEILGISDRTIRNKLKKRQTDDSTTTTYR
ncbi:MAG: sigma-54 dependent transcriptional regulator [Balneolaceae bacterium]